MQIDRVGLKRQAKELIRSSRPNVIYVGLIFLLFAILINFLSNQLVGISTQHAEQLSRYILEGDYDYASWYLGTISPSFTARLVDFALQLVYAVVSAGFIIFLLNTIRSAGACYGNLLDGFGFFWRIILLNILTGIFIALWSLLLIVPGIIASYRYSMAIYLLIDHPEMSPMDCIRESKRITTGHKMDLFVLDLSFIGWLMLAALPYVGYAVRIWTVPYINMTLALYYETLSGRLSQGAFNEPASETWKNDPPWEG